MRYLLMHKNHPVSEIEISSDGTAITSIADTFNLARMPVGVLQSDGVPSCDILNHWWRRRSIPASRSGIDKALRTLNLDAPQELLTKCFGLSLSDQYWIKPITSEIGWNDVNFFTNSFSEDLGDLLFGNKPKSDSFSMVSPDCTADGNLKKRWKIIDGKRCLLKGGAYFYQEPFNEVIAHRIARRLNIPHVEYRLAYEGKQHSPVSICEDFITENTEFVTAGAIAMALPRRDGESKYEHFLKCCELLKIPNATKSLDDMLTLDYLIANQDRHGGNFGAIRDVETLKYIGFAPIFDCGTSLRYDTPPEYIEPDIDIEALPFCRFHSEQISLVGCPSRYSLENLSDIGDEIARIFDEPHARVYVSSERVERLINVLEYRIQSLALAFGQNLSDQDEQLGQGMTML